MLFKKNESSNYDSYRNHFLPIFIVENAHFCRRFSFVDIEN